MQLNRESETRRLVIYFAKWCGTCAKIVPKLKTGADNAGLHVQLIDIDNPEDRARCSHVRWVPYIEYNNSEISIREFLQLISTRVDRGE